jgi:hypothetical protein
MMVPMLLKLSDIAVEFGQVQATREAFGPLGRALPGTVLFRVEDKMKVGEMLTRCRILSLLWARASRLNTVNSAISIVKSKGLL